ncbi:MAG: ABC transporter permease [Litorivicinaceae bacterium]|jgi:putative hydroxymethylpyrimidine transport system permease protein|nr:ABC transporter permease [Litorivicinaceae bacterium]MDP5328668.1 ABC transporter permease [Litorivicinaceae bacterium]MDP5330616.1 ABC transporter permease [Litorivicinaceae bacterium]MDP5340692.1 ABC transporter permease [Litorivicinaceae bacterium]MDP5341905.1 ABC transporter permease [Litorivicinaceae bacterium]
MIRVLRGLITTAILLTLWAGIVWIFDLPHYILPGPERVISVLWTRPELFVHHALITAAEISAGLALGGIFGLAVACLIADSPRLQRWTMPALVISQALPVFALAPILMLWLGYGFASKLAMTTLIVFFPVTAATLSGFRALPSSWSDTITALRGQRLRIFWQVRFPLALPFAGSGLRIAASVAPIGAVVGEWMGSAGGLGYLMLHANGRGQTDVLFAALVVLCGLALLIWGITNHLTRSLNRYQAFD